MPYVILPSKRISPPRRPNRDANVFSSLAMNQTRSSADEHHRGTSDSCCHQQCAFLCTLLPWHWLARREQTLDEGYGGGETLDLCRNLRDVQAYANVHSHSWECFSVGRHDRQPLEEDGCRQETHRMLNTDSSTSEVQANADLYSQTQVCVGIGRLEGLQTIKHKQALENCKPAPASTCSR